MDKPVVSYKSIAGGHYEFRTPALDEFRRAARAFTEEATSSRKQALKVLRQEGILNSKGKLTKNYS